MHYLLQTQPASLNTQELTRSPPSASLRKQLKHRNRDADSEEEEDGGEKTPQQHTFPNESIEAKLVRYKHYYLEEVKLRRWLENDWQRYVQTFFLEWDQDAAFSLYIFFLQSLLFVWSALCQ